jgi:hypothetical protein
MDGIVGRKALAEQLGDPSRRIIVDPDEPRPGMLEARVMEQSEIVESELFTG